MVSRVLIGNVNGFKARITKPGVDVESASSIESFLLHEQYSANNILLRTEVLVTPNMADYYSFPIPDPGFIPFVESYLWAGTQADYNNGVPATAARVYPVFGSGIRIKQGLLTLPNFGKIAGTGYVSLYELTIYNCRGR